MRKKFKRIIIPAVLLLLIAALIFTAINLLSCRRYSSMLPEYPALSSLPGPLQEQITEAGQTAKRNPSSENLGMLGMVYHSSAFYEKAEVCYRLASERKSKETLWNYYLGYLNMELGESGKAIENFKVVADSDPVNYLARYYMGEALQNTGMTSEAETVFRAVANVSDPVLPSANTLRKNYFPLQVYAKFQLARIFLDSERPDSAEKYLEEIIRDNITFGPAYRLLGTHYSSEGDQAKGTKYTNRANDLPVYTPPPDPLIDRLTLISRSDQYLMKQIDVAVQSLNPDYIIELLNNALKYFPDNRFLISKAVSLFLILGNGDQALHYTDRHRYLFRDDYKELMDVADLLYANGYRAQAIDYINTVKKSEKAEPGVHSQLAIWLSERGMKPESLSLINEQLKTDPDNPDVIVDAVYIFLLDGNNAEAVKLLQKLESVRPADALTLKMKAVLAEKKGDLQTAIKLYLKSFNANPEDLSTIRYLGMVLMREEMWSAAAGFFTAALEHHPNEPYLLESMGRLLITCPDKKFRNIPAGLEFSERAFYRFTSTPLTQVSAGINLSLGYAELGDRKMASSMIGKTLSLARKANAGPDYIAYIESLGKKFSLPY